MTAADWLIVRKAVQLNWEELAAELGLNVRTLRRYRRGELSVDETMRLAIDGLLCRKLHRDRPDRIESAEEMAARTLVRNVLRTKRN